MKYKFLMVFLSCALPAFLTGEPVPSPTVTVNPNDLIVTKLLKAVDARGWSVGPVVSASSKELSVLNRATGLIAVYSPDVKPGASMSSSNPSNCGTTWRNACPATSTYNSSESLKIYTAKFYFRDRVCENKPPQMPLAVPYVRAKVGIENQIFMGPDNNFYRVIGKPEYFVPLAAYDALFNAQSCTSGQPCPPASKCLDTPELFEDVFETGNGKVYSYTGDYYRVAKITTSLPAELKTPVRLSY